MPSLASTTAAVIVVFRPDSVVETIVGALIGQIALVVAVDNSIDVHQGLAAIAEQPGLVRIANQNRGGLAGAYNQALTVIRARHPGITQVVFLDEDSDASTLPRLLSDPCMRDRLSDGMTAAVSPAYVDRATGLRGKYIQLRRFGFDYLPRIFEGMRRVAFVINSMSIWSMQALVRIGPFNEGLAIDHVDTEYCLRARQAGLGVYVNGSFEFLHSIGQRRRFKLLGHVMQAGGHSPGRRYLIGRNTAWLGRQYLWREPAFAFLCLTRLIYEVVGIGMAEDRRAAKLWALLRGALVGVLSLRLR